ncbi:MAG: DUF4340 domain-containing protein [Candidatus Manganitrophaceae bacterium]
MRFKATVVLSFVLILLGVYLYSVELPGEKKKKEAELQEKRLYSFSQSTITHLAIQQAKGEAIEFSYEPTHPDHPWRITRPVETLGNDAALSALLSQLGSLEASRMVEEKPEEKSEALKEFGLDPPAYLVTMTINQVDTEILEIGSESLTGSEVYVRKGMGTPIYLAPASIKKALQKDLTGWRQQTLFTFAPADVKRIRIESPRRQMELSREGNGWEIKQPIAAKGDPNEISNLMGSLSSLRGEDFIDDRKEERKQRFGPHALKVSLLVGSVEWEALFYEAPKEPQTLYAMTTPLAPIYKINREAIRFLEEPVSTYRDKRLIDLTDPSQVEQITVEGKGGKMALAMVLEKKEGVWSIQAQGEGESPKKPASMEKVNAFLFDLTDLRVDRFPEGPPPALARVGLSEGPENGATTGPEWSVRLKGKEGKVIGELSFGRTEGGLIYAKSSNQPTPVLLKKEEVERIKGSAEKTLTADPPPPTTEPKKK